MKRLCIFIGPDGNTYSLVHDYLCKWLLLKVLLEDGTWWGLNSFYESSPLPSWVLPEMKDALKLTLP